MFRELLSAEFRPYGVLSELQLSQLEKHYKLLSQWNTHLNLTRISDVHEAVRFHYCECLFLARFLPGGSQRVVDVGSGAGFPGIPIAIFRPDCEITLVESHQRKSVFLREASRELSNVRVLTTRAQDVSDSFAWLVSRAVAPAEILELAVASDIAMLVGEVDAARLSGTSEPIPWGEHRVLFHVKRQRCDVPRGT